MHSITSSVIPVIYLVSYLIIYPIIKMIFIKKYRVKRLKTKTYLLNHPYKIKVILAV